MFAHARLFRPPTTPCVQVQLVAAASALDRLPSTSSTTPTACAAAQIIRARPPKKRVSEGRVLCWILRRFVDREFLERYLADALIPPQTGPLDQPPSESA